MRAKSALLAVLLSFVLVGCATNGAEPTPGPSEPHPEQPQPQPGEPGGPAPEDPAEPEDPAIQPARPDGNVTGLITTSTGDALADAAVTLREFTLQPAGLDSQGFGTFTDEHGQFGFTVTSPGLYSLEAYGSSEGVHQLVTVTGNDGGIVAQDIELTISAYGILNVTVHNPDGSAAADTLVFLAGTNHLGMTNALGETTIARIPAGTYTAIAKGNSRFGDSEPTPVSVTSGETSSAGALVLTSLVPVIHGISPAIIVNGSGAITITGEKFGAEQALGRIMYPNPADPGQLIDVIQGNGRIVSWSDTQIVFEPPDLSGVEPSTAGDESHWNQFQVLTAAGTSEFSDRVHSLKLNLSLNLAHPVLYASEPILLARGTISGSNADAIRNAPLQFSLDRGTASFVLAAVSTQPGPTGTGFIAEWTLTVTPDAVNVGDTFTLSLALGDEAPEVVTECLLQTFIDPTVGPYQRRWLCTDEGA